MPVFKNLLDTTFKKILLISIVFIVATGLTFFFYIIPRINETLLEEREQTLHETTEFIIEMFHELNSQEQSGHLKKGEAKEIAIGMINDYFYGDGNYFFIIDVENTKMIATPITSRLDATMADDVDAVGYPLGEDVLKNAQSGMDNFFLLYKWKKPDSTEVGQKLSYFSRFDPWGWLVGTGMYIDDVNQEVAAITRKIIAVFSFILALMISLLVYVIRAGAKIEKQKSDIELQFMSLIQHLPIGVFRVEVPRDGKSAPPIIWNKALVDLVEFPDMTYPSAKEFRLSNFLANKSDSVEMIKKAKEGTLNGTEYKAYSLTGKVLWIRLFGRIIKKNGTSFLDASIEDVTGNHEADALLKRSYQELQKTNEMKSEIISITSHELRAPLIKINDTISYFSAKNIENFNDQQKNHLEKIINNTKKLLEMINNMMDLEKLEKGELELEIKKIELNNILKDVHADFQSRCMLEKKECTINLSPVDVFIHADEIQIKRVFTNLIDNALKFTDSHVGVVDISTKITPDSVEIHIKDNGVGIAKRDKNDVFEKFKQVGDHIERKVSGSGLGLPIVKEIVEKLGGKIELKSQLGKGSDFYVILPTVKDDQ